MAWRGAPATGFNVAPDTPRRLCLVDDDILVRDALSISLRDAGYEVYAAPGAAAGFDIAARAVLDVLITDINMPGTDGAQLIAEARARWPDLAIIAISGAGGADLDALAKSQGADAALAKPFRARQLAELVERVLRRRAQS